MKFHDLKYLMSLVQLLIFFQNIGKTTFFTIIIYRCNGIDSRYIV